MQSDLSIHKYIGFGQVIDKTDGRKHQSHLSKSPNIQKVTNKSTMVQDTTTNFCSSYAQVK
jgi:hypothetical protein